jgi:4-azaleucine resistance transporter AzlC
MAAAMDTMNPLPQARWMDARSGLVDVFPAAAAAVPIGLLFGAVAAGKGLSVVEIMLMSALVFAGGAQFAAIESWAIPAPIAALAFGTLLINARHILMGASLAPKFRARPWQLWLGVYFMTDETWALAERRALSRPVTFAYWAGMGVCLFVAWNLSTAAGALVGSLLGDPSRIGADFVFTALFIGLIAGFGRSSPVLAAVAGSAAGAALVYKLAGPPWHVVAGAFAGIGAAYLAAGAEARR